MEARLMLLDDAARTLICPRCEERQPIREYVTLGMSPRYASQLHPIYRCRKCQHLFSIKE
jgi:ribosomal protein L40E